METVSSYDNYLNVSYKIIKKIIEEKGELTALEIEKIQLPSDPYLELTTRLVVQTTQYDEYNKILDELFGIDRWEDIYDHEKRLIKYDCIYKMEEDNYIEVRRSRHYAPKSEMNDSGIFEIPQYIKLKI